MTNRALVTFTIFATTILLGAMNSVSQPLTRLQSQSPISIKEILKDIGDRFDCYFTLESAMRKGSNADSLEDRLVKPFKYTGLDDSLSQLQHRIPHFAFRIKASNPKVVFVYDARLLARKKYGMDALVDEITYRGTSTGLIRELERQKFPLTSIGPGVSTQPVMVDLPYMFDIKESRIRVRDLLTNPIKPNGSVRILWIARTNLDSSLKTYVRYN